MRAIRLLDSLQSIGAPTGAKENVNERSPLEWRHACLLAREEQGVIALVGHERLVLQAHVHEAVRRVVLQEEKLASNSLR